MDFFDRQDTARRNSRRLVLYFILGVTALVVSVYLAVALLFSGLKQSDRPRYVYGYGYQVTSARSLWNPQLFLGVTAGTLAVIFIGSLTRMAELSRGGRSLATMLGGELVNPHTTDPKERVLLNVVEEMAIASGVPVPAVYVLRGEQGINAFAAGNSTSDAVIGVTRGSIEVLSRDELQGVIAHEFSHILNGDMRLNLRLIGWIFGILCIAVIGRTLLRIRSGGKKGNALPLLGLALVGIGWIGVFFGRLIQAAVSREREFLADASAVQFTRNPAGLSGALQKIGGVTRGSKLESSRAEEASHMFFGNAVGSSMFHLMDTHPPLVERIRRLDPAFDGQFPKVVVPQKSSSTTSERVSLREEAIASAASWGTQTLTPPPLPATAILQTVGKPAPRHLHYAAALREALTPATTHAAREPLGACAIVYGFLLSNEPRIREKQLQQLTGATSPGVAEETLRLLPEVQQVATRARLPLIDLALPALRQLSAAQFGQFREAVRLLVDCDNEIDLFEYMLQRIVLRHLEPHFQQPEKPLTQYYSLRPLAGDCAVVLSALAWVGQDDPARVQRAFQEGAGRLQEIARTGLTLCAADQCGLAQIDTALERLAQAVPQIRRNLLYACALTVATDGVIRETEAEMLRAVADGLDCPVPPLIPARENEPVEA